MSGPSICSETKDNFKRPKLKKPTGIIIIDTSSYVHTHVCPIKSVSQLIFIKQLHLIQATRGRRFEQFLWQELYDEYMRQNDRLMNPSIEKSNSEYYEQFCKETPAVDEDAKAAAINQYPLYGTVAITLWNHTGDVTKDFKKRYSITRPVHDQTEQFG